MVKQGAPRRALSRSIKHSSRIEISSPLTPWTSPSPPIQDHDPSSSNVLEWDPDNFPDQVYLDAAMIFQDKHKDKVTAQRVISYGKRSKGTVLKVKDEVWQRRAYELAFNTLKYQDLLEDILIDSSFYLAKTVPDDLMSLVVVMLYDLQDRKFLPRKQPANQVQVQEEVAKVREVENCLLRFKTKLAASLARCRIKHDLLSIDCMLPESVRRREEKGSNLPIHAWINTLRTSMQEVCEVLKSAGFSQVKSVTQLEGQMFCEDIQCLDLLVFPTRAKRELHKTNLLKDHRLVIQDKSCCIAPWALRSLLVPDGDVVLAGAFSAATVAHTAAIVTSTHTHMPTTHHSKPARSSMRVFVCVGDCTSVQRDELQGVLSSMGCSNVKLLSESLHTLDVCDTRLQKVHLILLTPQCSLSAVSNPVDYLLQENGDKELLQDLSQGSVSQSRLQTLISEQKRDLAHALRFPRVRVVVYSTCSSLPQENEDVVKSALTPPEPSGDDGGLQPFTLSRPSLLLCDKDEGSGGKKADFFRLEASDQSNGCFLAVLTRQPEVTKTPQEVIARATASGLLDGIHVKQPTKKEGRGRKTRKTHHSRLRPHVSVTSQSQVAEFLNREAKLSISAPAAAQERTNDTFSPRVSRKSKPNPPNSCKPTSSSTTSTFSNPSHTLLIPGASSSSSTGLSSYTDSFLLGASSSTLSSTANTATDSALFNTSSTSSINGLSVTSLTKNPTPSYRTLNRTNSRRTAAPVVPPPAPPRGRQEVLRPVLISFPPPQFPSLVPASASAKIKLPSWTRSALLTHTRFRSSLHPQF